MLWTYVIPMQTQTECASNHFQHDARIIQDIETVVSWKNLASCSLTFVELEMAQSEAQTILTSHVCNWLSVLSGPFTFPTLS